MSESVEQKTALITGGTGFIAAALAMRLLEEGKCGQVVLFDRNPDQSRLTGYGAPAPNSQAPDRYTPVKDRITVVQGDLTLLPHVLAVFDAHKPDSVFHLGALLSAGADANPTMGFQVDLVGAWHVLEAARIYCQNNASLTPIRVLFPSTIASFGKFLDTTRSVPNETAQMPTTMYGCAKVSVERLGEYYSARTRDGALKRGWIDFRAVRFPSVIGASRGPGGTTAYSTLMVQEPARGRPYTAYVNEDTVLDVIYVDDAVDALVRLHDAPAGAFVPQDALKERRVYNIAGIRIAGKAPTAGDIAKAVKSAVPNAVINYDPDSALVATVSSFGVLDDQAARADWGWPGAQNDLQTSVQKFVSEVKAYPKRIKALELY